MTVPRTPAALTTSKLFTSIHKQDKPHIAACLFLIMGVRAVQQTASDAHQDGAEYTVN
jgi:hypothetical protein